MKNRQDSNHGPPGWRESAPSIGYGDPQITVLGFKVVQSLLGFDCIILKCEKDAMWTFLSKQGGVWDMYFLTFSDLSSKNQFGRFILTILHYTSLFKEQLSLEESYKNFQSIVVKVCSFSMAEKQQNNATLIMSNTLLQRNWMFPTYF